MKSPLPFLGWVRAASLFLCLTQTVLAMVLTNSTRLESILDRYRDKDEEWWRARPRGKRAISEGDMHLILDLHNKLRGQVHPPASNMEYMVWDYELERSAEHWAHTCRWEHGPSHMLTQIGQNLGAHWGRDRPPTYHVQAWYDEVRYYSYPYSQECNPHCPFRCSGPVCTHYTQLVWATSNRIGCAINVCYNMNVWGMIWAKAVYLVCNYSPPGNWWGHAPYKYGTPCSACPASYAGGCRDNLCYKDGGVDRRPPPEIEETNYIEPEPEPVRDREPQPRAQSPDPSPNDNLDRNQAVSTEQMCQQVECDTKLRDQCKGTTCNRYECPPGCLDRAGKVVGTGHYDMQSSVCGAALHSGVIDNDGGWLDVTRLGRKQQFTKSYKNGIQSIGKNRSANSFKVESVPVKAVRCDTTVAIFCPFKKPLRHCPRLYCPRNCLRDGRARVIGTKFYSDKSSICRAAIHAGVIQNESGGYLDVMPVDKRRQYSGSYQNGITSESLVNPTGGKAFRVFAVI
ncbi:cysteine-rich secretory protein LCCL domain-containing 1-like [Seriola aureovittata]|uniref:cysteine-rich secretory protein LCCL domain-containing 1-like n=1 Tax=Seriola aureovittata TaxID=2871759 RepID=UPI0024BECD9C|nr:cysteine-rich secretory protein LCCL domain-containing 1-like [Seriola aureovittata]XP_056246437.1 cysteine-rich secretory protein LCCL domain-containing 1-like [Seriola aureovittata]